MKEALRVVSAHFDSSRLVSRPHSARVWGEPVAKGVVNCGRAFCSVRRPWGGRWRWQRAVSEASGSGPAASPAALPMPPGRLCPFLSPRRLLSPGPMALGADRYQGF